MSGVPYVCLRIVGGVDRHMEQCGQERPCPDHDPEEASDA